MSDRPRAIRYNHLNLMFDSLHGDEGSSQQGSTAERDVKVEQLLLSGLDHYFKGHYERAIDVWTRVLFLDRTHARARAYIERARAALAEHLRESEELLHSGVEAFNRGDIDKARALLTSAVEGGGGRDEALGFLDRLNRLETAAGEENVDRSPARAGPTPAGRRRVVAPLAVRKPVRVLPLILLMTVLLVSGYVALSWEQWSPLVVGSPVQAVPSPGFGPSRPLPVPSPAEVTLVRAERLVEEGRHQEALELLTTIGPGDPLAGDADALRTSIQQGLLASVTAAPATAATPVE